MFDSLNQSEGKILIWIQDNLRVSWLNPIIKGITYLGEAGWFWIVLSILLIIWKKYRTVGVVSLISLVFSFLVNTIIIKHIFNRVRPYDAVEGLTRLVGKQPDSSFPSGHTTAAFSVAIVLLLLMPKKFGVPSLILAVLVMFSRLYVGVHYPTDVLTALILTTIYTVVIVMIYRKKFSERFPVLRE